MATVDEAIGRFELHTGRPVASWVQAVQTKGLGDHGQVVAWLKAEHGLSHAHANHIAKRATEAAAPRSGDDPIAYLFSGKEGLRPTYDQLAAAVTGLGLDVELVPKKANVSVRRRRQFAGPAQHADAGRPRPDPRSRGFGRLESSGSFNAMFSHRVRLERFEDVDAEVIGWLREAYDAAG